jgi:regulator of RNase E activity RraA
MERGLPGGVEGQPEGLLMIMARDWTASRPPLTEELVATFQELDTCAVSNAVERFGMRLRNEGFADGSIRCMFEDLPSVIGHAVTARIRCSTPPPVGHSYIDRTDWWSYLASVPPPRVLVVEDIDGRPGLGAFVGGIHANIFRAMGCVAYATNGSVRDLPAVRQLGFQLFAGSVAVSHAFVHLIDFGDPVTIGGLTVGSTEIVFGDRHGLMTLPLDLVNVIPGSVADHSKLEGQVIALCRSSQFSIDSLRTLMRRQR